MKCMATMLAAVNWSQMTVTGSIEATILVVPSASIAGSEARRRQLLDAVSVGSGGIAGIVGGMALLAATLGFVCFWLGRRAMNVSVETESSRAGDAEVSLLTDPENRPSPMEHSLTNLGSKSTHTAADCQFGPSSSEANCKALLQDDEPATPLQIQNKAEASVAGLNTAVSHSHLRAVSLRGYDPTMAAMEGLDLSIQSWLVDSSEIELCRRPDGSEWLLGQGAYGKVYRALRGGVQEVAVKVLLCTDEEQLVAFKKEIAILKSISYDRNIVQFYGACINADSKEPMLLLEYCEGGNVRCLQTPNSLRNSYPPTYGDIKNAAAWE